MRRSRSGPRQAGRHQRPPTPTTICSIIHPPRRSRPGRWRLGAPPAHPFRLAALAQRHRHPVAAQAILRAIQPVPEFHLTRPVPVLLHRHSHVALAGRPLPIIRHTLPQARLRRHPLGNPRSALPATNDQPAVTCQLNGDLLGQLSDPRRWNRNGTIGATRWSYPAVNDTGCGERPATPASRLLVSTTRFREQRGGFEEKTSRQDVMLETSVTAGHDEEASHPLPTRMTLMTDPP